MNYLELVQDLAAETGTERPEEITGLSSPATGHQADLARWIRRACREIELEHTDWYFRRAQMSLSLSAGTNSYDLTSLVPDYDQIWPYVFPYGREWALLDDNRYQGVRYIRWDEWRGWVESQSEKEGRPRLFSVDPDDTLFVFPKPREAHTFKVDYAREATELSDDGDEPAIPDKFHSAIVFFAIVEYAGYDSATQVYQRASRQLNRVMMRLRNDQLPDTHVSRWNDP